MATSNTLNIVATSQVSTLPLHLRNWYKQTTDFDTSKFVIDEKHGNVYNLDVCFNIANCIIIKLTDKFEENIRELLIYFVDSIKNSKLSVTCCNLVNFRLFFYIPDHLKTQFLKVFSDSKYDVKFERQTSTTTFGVNLQSTLNEYQFKFKFEPNWELRKIVENNNLFTLPQQTTNLFTLPNQNNLFTLPNQPQQTTQISNGFGLQTTNQSQPSNPFNTNQSSNNNGLNFGLPQTTQNNPFNTNQQPQQNNNGFGLPQTTQNNPFNTNQPQQNNNGLNFGLPQTTQNNPFNTNQPQQNNNGLNFGLPQTTTQNNPFNTNQQLQSSNNNGLNFGLPQTNTNQSNPFSFNYNKTVSGSTDFYKKL